MKARGDGKFSVKNGDEVENDSGRKKGKAHSIWALLWPLGSPMLAGNGS